MALGDETSDIAVPALVALHGFERVRAAIASAAKGKTGSKKDDAKAWFKRQDRGELLADIIWSSRTAIAGSELEKGLLAVQKFAYHSDVGVDQAEPAAGDE